MVRLRSSERAPVALRLARRLACLRAVGARSSSLRLAWVGRVAARPFGFQPSEGRQAARPWRASQLSSAPRLVRLRSGRSWWWVAVVAVTRRSRWRRVRRAGGDAVALTRRFVSWRDVVVVSVTARWRVVTRVVGDGGCGGCGRRVAACAIRHRGLRPRVPLPGRQVPARPEASAREVMRCVRAASESVQ